MVFRIFKILGWPFIVLALLSCDKKSSGPLFYRIVGHSESKIIFLHGLLGSQTYWNEVVPELSSNHELVLMDLLGFGDSPKPHAEYTVAEHLSKIDQTINLIVPKKENFALVGHSMGAILALDYIIEHPDQVRKLVLINAPMVTDEKDMRAAVAESSSKFMVTMTFDKTWGKFACKIHEFLPFISYPIIRILEPELPPVVAKAAGQHTWDSFSGSFQHVLLEQNFFKLLSKVKAIPILIIASTEDEYTRPEALKRLPESNNIKLVLLDGDHNVLLRQPKRLASEIDQFLKDN
jgi:pimeloyl-ACP methyl ester carboxylesterase